MISGYDYAETRNDTEPDEIVIDDGSDLSTYSLDAIFETGGQEMYSPSYRPFIRIQDTQLYGVLEDWADQGLLAC